MNREELAAHLEEIGVSDLVRAEVLTAHDRWRTLDGWATVTCRITVELSGVPSADYIESFANRRIQEALTGAGVECDYGSLDLWEDRD